MSNAANVMFISNSKFREIRNDNGKFAYLNKLLFEYDLHLTAIKYINYTSTDRLTLTFCTKCTKCFDIKNGVLNFKPQ